MAVHPITLEGPAAAPLKGLRIAVIADLHAGNGFIGADKIAQVVALTNAAHPDLILLAGDYTGDAHAMAPEAIARLLEPLAAPLGVYAVLGNHDFSDDAPRMEAALRAAGIAVLDNRSRVIARGPLTLVGIGDTYSHNADPAKALAGVRGGALCFTHSPDVFPQLPESCLLTVAAHTHGGQVLLPLLGRPAVPFVSTYGQRYAAGLIREGGKTLFVATGIGTSGLTVRFGVTPEVSLLEITAQ